MSEYSQASPLGELASFVAAIPPLIGLKALLSRYISLLRWLCFVELNPRFPIEEAAVVSRQHAVGSGQWEVPGLTEGSEPSWPRLGHNHPILQDPARRMPYREYTA